MDLPNRSFGHMALFYRPGEGELAARFFQALGCRVQNLGALSMMNGAAPDDHTPVYKIVIEHKEVTSADSVQHCYLTAARPEQLAFEERFAKFVSAEPDSSFKDFRALKLEDPEMFFHLAFRYDSLEELETAISNVDDLIQNQPGFERRVTMRRFRPFSSDDPDVEARIAMSPVFKPDDKKGFGPFNIQVFIHTDLFGGELLTLGQTVELDFEFREQSEKSYAAGIGQGAAQEITL